MELKKLTAEAAFSRQPVIRTSESDPANHTSGHIGLFYTIPPEDADRWISRGLSKRAYRSHQAFNETCLMVRSPGVELVSFLRAADYSVPNVRYIVYGRPGCGKSTTLAYLMHYCGRAGWFIVHEPWLPWHLRYSRDVEPSTFQPGLVDYPLYAAGWLAYFQKMNEHLLSPPDGSSAPVIANRWVYKDALCYIIIAQFVLVNFVIKVCNCESNVEIIDEYLQVVNLLKCIGVRQLHLKVFNAIQV